MATLKYRRVLLKLSGTVFAGSDGFGIDPAAVQRIARVIGEIQRLGVQVAIVNGAGNLFRYRQVKDTAMRRVYADAVGMMGTMMNSLSLKDFLEQMNIPVSLFSAAELQSVIPPYDIRRAQDDLAAGKVVLISGGTGHPFFTTDTAAVLRALETGADAVLKATDVDGVYDADPRRNKKATKYDTVTYTEVRAKNLKVMDQTAFALAQEHALPILVFNFSRAGSLRAAVTGKKIGTLVRV